MAPKYPTFTDREREEIISDFHKAVAGSRFEAVIYTAALGNSKDPRDQAKARILMDPTIPVPD